jgi:hypothetical protein
VFTSLIIYTPPNTYETIMVFVIPVRLVNSVELFFENKKLYNKIIVIGVGRSIGIISKYSNRNSLLFT